MNVFHVPVLLTEVIENLNIQSGKKYIDATIGGGGHGFEILEKGGILLGVDQDQDAIRNLERSVKLKAQSLKLILVLGNFRDIKKIAKENGFEKVAGILFDLGVSSYQIEGSGRGFSFLRDEPLDMRMGSARDEGVTAADIVNTLSAQELQDIFEKYGEEHNAKKIADAIVEKRHNEKMETSRELATVIEQVIPRRGYVHPATRVFQALRIVVNDEIGSLKKGLAEGFDLLEPGGRMAVISFHSLEDRVVKQAFREAEAKGDAHVVTKKPMVATLEEIIRNPRARSAKLRVVERI